jgi:hypothetical protein
MIPLYQPTDYDESLSTLLSITSYQSSISGWSTQAQHNPSLVNDLMLGSCIMYGMISSFSEQVSEVPKTRGTLQLRSLKVRMLQHEAQSQRTVTAPMYGVL